MSSDNVTEDTGLYEEGTVYFPEGLFGFEGYRKFVPVPLEPDSDAVLTLHSLEEEGLAFIIMNPFMLKEDYAPEVPPEELEILGSVSDESDYSWYVICAARKPAQESTVNLKCPIVFNTVTRKGRQVILENQEYGFRHKLKDLTGKGKKTC